MNEQNYKNHARMHPIYHFVLSLLVLGGFITAVTNVFQSDHTLGAVTLLLLASALLVTFTLLRLYPLKAQDRAIRAEENLRHFVLTGKLLDDRLTPGQIVALRFAPDEEFPSLAEKAAAEGLKPKEIKQAVVNWRGDYYRI
ncbi:DUF6526 family protein [Fictibacillus iocasae]|uniref:DUF6526 family protein n=1 Tax=Fictibacillus iocasae TaxID=2715437 RepID=A0ABW2NY15_9BACL